MAISPETQIGFIGIVIGAFIGIIGSVISAIATYIYTNKLPIKSLCGYNSSPASAKWIKHNITFIT